MYGASLGRRGMALLGVDGSDCRMSLRSKDSMLKSKKGAGRSGLFKVSYQPLPAP